MHEFKTRLEPFGQGWVNCPDRDRELRAACGCLQWARECDTLAIDADLGLCKAYMLDGTSCQNFGGTSCSAERLDEEARLHPEAAEDLACMKEKMCAGLEHCFRAREHFTERQLAHNAEGHLWGGTWAGHANPKFADFALYGTDEYRARVERCRADNPGHDAFYDAMETMLDAIDVLGSRFGALAQGMLAQGGLDERQIRHLEIIRRTFDHAPKQPCRDFAEGVVMFSMIFTLDGRSSDSPGWFDQYMYSLWQNTEPALRREYLENLWEFFHQTRTWNLTIAGSDENWNDLSNDLTYAILEVTAEHAYNTPNLTMRCHRNTPEKLLRAAYRAIRTGCGMPTLYNDEAVCPALESQGIPPRDAHQYVMNGCNQIDIMGKSHMGLEDGEVALAKAVEFTLHNGVSGTSGKALGLPTGDPASFGTYEEFYDAFLTQLDYLTDIAAEMSNAAQFMYRRSTANPLRSLLIEGCMEKARDYKDGGPLYGNGQILAESIADTVDSLAVIKKYVYEDKAFSMKRLVGALDADFEGFDDIYQTVTHTPLKFGNDVAYVDQIARDVVDHFNRHLREIPTVRGGWFGGGCSPFNRAARYGKSLGALPNGHKRSAPLIADSIGAVPGADVNGPTALLNSCLAFDHKLATSGFILNLKFDKNLFRSEAGEAGFLALVRSYFGRNGQQLSVSVVSADELRDAQVCPEAHRSLIVRVGGYSDYFVNLSRELQDNVIARTAY